jgi:hypothetical protein
MVIVLLAILAFVLSGITCFVVVAKINTKRDLDHQIPLLKSFLFALVWTPAFMIAVWGVFSIWYALVIEK